MGMKELEEGIRNGKIGKGDTVMVVSNLTLKEAKMLGINNKTYYKYRRRRDRVVETIKINSEGGK